MVHNRSRKFPFSSAVLAWAALLAVAGCNGGGEPAPAGGGVEKPAPAKPPQRPPFLVYETSGRKLLLDAFGKHREKKLAQKIYTAAHALRIEDRLGGPTVVLRLDRKVMWQIDEKSRTYREATFGELAAQVEHDKKLLSLQLKDRKLPAARRRALEVALGRRRPRVAVKTGEKPVPLLARQCRHVRYFEDGQLRIEEWVARDLVSPCDLTEVRALTGDFSRDLLRELQGRRGFGLKTRVVGRLPTVPRLTEIAVTELELPAKLDPTLFELPAGYKKAAPRRRPPRD